MGRLCPRAIDLAPVMRQKLDGKLGCHGASNVESF
jgi:hypothetical protein